MTFPFIFHVKQHISFSLSNTRAHINYYKNQTNAHTRSRFDNSLNDTFASAALASAALASAALAFSASAYGKKKYRADMGDVKKAKCLVEEEGGS